MTGPSGAVTLSRQYDAFGNPQVGSTTPGHAFTGREWDTETGLYYYGARYYDPKVGRFISEDPIGFAGGLNLYAYVRGNPTNLIDPFGLVDKWYNGRIEKRLRETCTAYCQTLSEAASVALRNAMTDQQLDVLKDDKTSSVDSAEIMAEIARATIADPTLPKAIKDELQGLIDKADAMREKAKWKDDQIKKGNKKPKIPCP